MQALSVSRRSAPATTILKLALTHRLSNCTSSSTLSSCPHSSNLRPRHSPSPLILLAASSSSEETSLAVCTVCASLAEVLASTILSLRDISASATAATAVLEDIPLRSISRTFSVGWQRGSRSIFPAPGLRLLRRACPRIRALVVVWKLVVLLAPRPARLIFPRGRGRRRELGLRGRVRAVEEAWKTMRDQASRAKSKGKASGGVGRGHLGSRRGCELGRGCPGKFLKDDHHAAHAAVVVGAVGVVGIVGVVGLLI